MKITSLSVGRTLSDGNYGSRRLDLTVELKEGDNVDEAIKTLNDIVDFNLEGKGTNPLAPAKGSKASAKEEGAKVGRESKEEKAEATEEAKPKKKAAKKAAKKTTKKVKNKHVPYNRDLKTHKSFFSTMMDTIDENWRGQGKKAAVATSKKMEGEDMFSAKDDSNILEEFRDRSEKIYLKNFKELRGKI